MIMPITLEEIRRFLGRSLQDPYGRTFGKVVGISANLKDEITGVGIEVGNGEFVQCPGDRVKISADTLVLAPTWKVEAEEFRKEFDVVTRRLKALDELFSVGDIQKDVNDAIDTGLVRAMAERKEVDSIFGYLSKLDSSSSTVPAPAIQAPVAAPSPTPSAPNQPKDQVMVLHVRET